MHARIRNVDNQSRSRVGKKSWREKERKRESKKKEVREGEKHWSLVGYISMKGDATMFTCTIGITRLIQC